MTDLVYFKHKEQNVCWQNFRPNHILDPQTLIESSFIRPVLENVYSMYILY